MLNPDNPVMVILSKLCDLIILNVMVIIFSIPIVTTGAAVTTMFYITLKIVKGEEDSSIIKMFIKNFRTNFKSSTFVWLIELIAAVFLYLDFTMIYSSDINVFGVIMTIAAVVCLFITVYLQPILSRYDNTLLNSFKNALLYSIIYLPRTLIIIAIYLIWFYIISVSLAIFIPIGALMGISLPAYLASYQFNKIFNKIEKISKTD